MSEIRLDSLSTQLAALYRAAGTAQRHKAALLACEKAVAVSGLSDSSVDQALAAARSNESVTSNIREKIAALADALDDEYLRLDEGGDASDRPAVLAAFSRARAVAAVAFLVGSEETLHEALYEAVMAFEDASEVVSAAQAALQ